MVKVAVILPKECPLLYELTIFDFIGWTGRRGANTVWRVSAKSLPTLSRVFLCTVTNKWWTHTGGLSLPIQKMLSHNALQIVKFSWIHHFSCQRRRAIKTSYGNTFLLLLFKTLCVPLKVTDVKGQTTIDSFAAKVYLLLSKTCTAYLEFSKSHCSKPIRRHSSNIGTCYLELSYKDISVCFLKINGLVT